MEQLFPERSTQTDDALQIESVDRGVVVRRQKSIPKPCKNKDGAQANSQERLLQDVIVGNKQVERLTLNNAMVLNALRTKK